MHVHLTVRPSVGVRCRQHRQSLLTRIAESVVIVVRIRRVWRDNLPKEHRRIPDIAPLDRRCVSIEIAAGLECELPFRDARPQKSPELVIAFDAWIWCAIIDQHHRSRAFCEDHLQPDVCIIGIHLHHKLSLLRSGNRHVGQDDFIPLPVAVKFGWINDADQRRRKHRKSLHEPRRHKRRISRSRHRHLDEVKEIRVAIIQIRKRKLKVVIPRRCVVNDRQILRHLRDRTLRLTAHLARDLDGYPRTQFRFGQPVAKRVGKAHFHHVSLAGDLSILLGKRDKHPKIRPRRVHRPDEFRSPRRSRSERHIAR